MDSSGVVMAPRRNIRKIARLCAVVLFISISYLLLDHNFRILPNPLHDHIRPDNAGLVVTDVAITKCSVINPFASCILYRASWYRVEKDLHLGSSWTHGSYVYVKLKREQDLAIRDKVVVDLTVNRLDPAQQAKYQLDGKWESRPLGLWIRKMNAADLDKTVTAIDVLFGDDAVEARHGWQMVGTPLILDAPSTLPLPQISFRKGPSVKPIKPELRVGRDGTFKIMQLADIHFSTGAGYCRDPVPEGYHGGECLADPRTLEFVSRMLDEEKPDLVVLSGDQVNGNTAPDAQSAIFKYAKPLIARKIPYVSIFGNHDSEDTLLSRSAQMTLIESLPYSLSESGPREIDGVGNYYVEVLNNGTSKDSALTIYLLDSHAYSRSWKYKGYDWIKQNQIDWFTQTSSRLRERYKEYTENHTDLAFIHIPLPEYRDATARTIGAWREGVTAPQYNSKFRDALVAQGVKIMSCGHDHANEYCMLNTDEAREPKLWMCYAGGAGFGGYGGYGGFVQRVRFFDFDMGKRRISTYKRLEHPQHTGRINEQVVMDAGNLVV